MSEPIHPVRVAALQCALADSLDQNVARVEALVREAAATGAHVILPPELFEGPYFCREEKDAFFDWARPVAGHPTLAQQLAHHVLLDLPALQVLAFRHRVPRVQPAVDHHADVIKEPGVVGGRDEYRVNGAGRSRRTHNRAAPIKNHDLRKRRPAWTPCDRTVPGDREFCAQQTRLRRYSTHNQFGLSFDRARGAIQALRV